MSKKQLLLTSSLLSGMLFAAPAFAQDPQPPADDATEVGELIITGTRLRLPDYVVPVPVQSVGEQTIQRSGEAAIADILTEIPALTSSLTDQLGADQTTPFYVGLNLLDLRNLGTDRTLVLVNGRRHVAGIPGSAAVDVNTIPTDLIERVDITTGGSSAIYGADAVSGVVNFILKRDFEGTEVRAQYGWSEEGGGETAFTSVLWGKNFAEDRANLTLAAEYYDRKDVKFSDRRYTAPGIRRTFVTNPADVDQATNTFTDDPNIYDNILSNNLTYIDTSPEGSIITGDDFAFRFLGNGQPFINGQQTGSFIAIGGSGSLLDLYNDDLLPGVERINVNALGTFNFNDMHRGFMEMKYVRSKSDFTGQPHYDYGLFVPIDNPYIPAVVRNDFLTEQANGTDAASLLEFLGYSQGPGVVVARDNFDFGPTVWDLDRETYRAVLGVEGEFSPTLNYEASVTYGKSKQDQHGQNIRINERFFAATDVTTDAQGNPVCRSNLDPNAIPFGDIFAQFPFDPATWGTTFTPGPGSGCQPLNIFGVNQNSKAALDWVHTDLHDLSSIEQLVFNAFIEGTTEQWFTIPWGGAPSFVFGAEHRREESRYVPSAIEQEADATGYPISYIGAGTTTIGKFDVSELFTEISLPLLTDKPFAKDLTFIGAYRWSDYSTSGETNTWNLGLTWRPVDDIMFRGGVAKAVRAPNISDLFLGRSQTFETISDPCDNGNLGSGDNPTLRAANCAAAIAPILGAGAGYTDTSSEATAGFIFGNVNLVPETADTQTLGVVWTPGKVPGLSFSLDWYNIEIEDAIQASTAQEIVNFCYDLPQPNDYCSLISRQGTGDPFPFRLNGFNQIPNNIAVYATSGVDFTARYRLDPSDFGVERDIGIFNFSLVGSKLMKLTFYQTPEADPDYDKDEIFAPGWQGTLDITWEKGPWTVNYGFAYQNKTERINQITRRNEPDYSDPKYWDYPEREEHDIQVSYRVGDDDRYEIYGGVNNITDQKPVFQDFYYPVSPLGRFGYVGFRARWD